MDKDWRLYAAAILVVFGANTGSMLSAYNTPVHDKVFPLKEGRELDDRIDQINVLQQLVLHRLNLVEEELRNLKKKHENK